jgi:hypothetical protein
MKKRGKGERGREKVKGERGKGSSYLKSVKMPEITL